MEMAIHFDDLQLNIVNFIANPEKKVAVPIHGVWRTFTYHPAIGVAFMETLKLP